MGAGRELAKHAGGGFFFLGVTAAVHVAGRLLSQDFDALSRPGYLIEGDRNNGGLPVDTCRTIRICENW